jgi:hypothetical protein
MILTFGADAYSDGSEHRIQAFGLSQRFRAKLPVRKLSVRTLSRRARIQFAQTFGPGNLPVLANIQLPQAFGPGNLPVLANIQLAQAFGPGNLPVRANIQLAQAFGPGNLPRLVRTFTGVEDG